MTEVSPQPEVKPFYCFKCNRELGKKCPLGLRTDTVTLHMKQSFSCNKCKQRYVSVALAFGFPTQKEEVPTAQESPPQADLKPPVQDDSRNKIDKGKKK